MNCVNSILLISLSSVGTRDVYYFYGKKYKTFSRVEIVKTFHNDTGCHDPLFSVRKVFKTKKYESHESDERGGILMPVYVMITHIFMTLNTRDGFTCANDYQVGEEFHITYSSFARFTIAKTPAHRNAICLITNPC